MYDKIHYKLKKKKNSKEKKKKKLMRTTKSFCLYWLYLLIFTIIEIKTKKN